jgi:cytoskeletal protein RodZ
MAAHDDEKILVGLLRRNLRGGTSVSRADCPGPDVLAAYYDRSLDAPETARWEMHFSSCAHCREELAALTRSEAPAERTAPPKWLGSWGILAPAAAALALLLVLVVYRPWHKVPTRTEPAPQVASTSSPGPSEETKELAENAAPAPAPAKESDQKKLHGAPPPSRAERVGTGVGAGVAGGMPSTSHRAAKPAQKTAPATGAEWIPKPAQPEAQEQGDVTTSAASAQVAQAPAAPSPPAAEPAPLESNRATAASSAVKQHGESQNSDRFSAAVRRGTQADAVGRLRTLDTRSLEVRIPTPDRSVIWRAGQAGLVERSEDGGKTWKGQITSASADLLAGSAPTPNVCWVVGRGGTILLTTDGENWRKINSPTDADLVAIHATNAKKATVEASDGKRFRTEDSGVAWRTK